MVIRRLPESEVVSDPVGLHEWLREPGMADQQDVSVSPSAPDASVPGDLDLDDARMILALAYTVLSAFEYDILERMLLDGRRAEHVSSEFRLGGPQLARGWLLEIIDRLHGHLEAQESLIRRTARGARPATARAEQ